MDLVQRPSSPAFKDISLSQMMLSKLSNAWERRAQVKTEEIDYELLFEPNKSDFREDLLPFKNHPDFLSLDYEIKQQILSCGWLAYNEKTIHIEERVITPSCNDIIHGILSGADNLTSQKIAAETLVDEAYHILLVINACQLTRQKRDLEHIKIPQFKIVDYMEREKFHVQEDWKKKLIQLSSAIVSEVFISDYLRLLSNDMNIQPINRLTVDIHLKDELAHSSIFKALTKCIYHKLDTKQKKFFIETLPKPVRWFANVELQVWEAMLTQLDIPKTKQIIADCRLDSEVDLQRIDFTGITNLAEEVGIFDDQLGLDSFERHGLLH